jgi:YVTN family beta-propeller protein
VVGPVAQAAPRPVGGPHHRSPGEPVAIAITPNGKTVYVVNYVSDTVTPTRTANNKAEPDITVGNSPDAIAITP